MLLIYLVKYISDHNVSIFSDNNEMKRIECDYSSRLKIITIIDLRKLLQCAILLSICGVQ